MKPKEILSLIEEAAGTSHFKKKREEALAQIEKKDLRLQEIESILSQEVGPKLELLNAEKDRLDEYRASVAEMEDLEHLLIAHAYYLRRIFAEDSSKMDEMLVIAERLHTEIEQIKKDRTEASQELENARAEGINQE